MELPSPPEAGTAVELPPPGSGLQPDPYVYSQPLSVPVVDPQSLRGATGGMPPPPVAMPAQSYRWDFRPVSEGEAAGSDAGSADRTPSVEVSGEVPTGYQPIAPLPLMPAPQYLQSPAVTAAPTKLVTAVWILAVASLCQTVAIIWLALR